MAKEARHHEECNEHERQENEDELTAGEKHTTIRAWTWPREFAFFVPRSLSDQ